MKYHELNMFINTIGFCILVAGAFFPTITLRLIFVAMGGLLTAIRIS